MEDLISFLQSLPPVLVYLAVFILALVENIFPPFPSDLVVVFGGSLAAIGESSLAATIIAATAGSTIGFVLMYKIGFWFGRQILSAGKIRFLPLDAVERVERWFARYGYGIIVANRFLAGTRAIISFFAGISRLSLAKTAALSFISALVWNSILVGSGYALGQNWQEIGYYLSSYFQIVTSVIVLIAIAFVAKALLKKRNQPGT